MKNLLRRLSLGVVAAALVVGGTTVVAAPANAGNGCGFVQNYSYSVRAVTASTDYLGRSGHRTVNPGQRVGACGNDMDAVYVPGGFRTQIQSGSGGTVIHNRCGLTGYWQKVSDWGAYVGVTRC